MGHLARLLLAVLTVLILAVPTRTDEPPARTNALWRRLLQAPSNTQGVATTSSTGGRVLLNLCETNLCESFRVDGVCDRWARSSGCTKRDIFYVRGDPGDNDKAEMFFNLRSPFDISCNLGRCTPEVGGGFDVFVAEGCIPEKDYVSEMQDATDRSSKQVKIYLRRAAEFYISVERKGLVQGNERNCSYGITTGSIESVNPSRCFDFRRLSEVDIVNNKVPNCRDVMPVFTGAVAPDTSTQATFIVALIGVGLLCIALLVLAFILVRRFRRRKEEAVKTSQRSPEDKKKKKQKQKPVDQELDGIQLGDVTSPRAKPDLSPSTKNAIGTQGKQQRNKLADRLARLDQEEGEGADDDLDIPGGGVRRWNRDKEREDFEGPDGGVERLRKGRGGGKLVFQSNSLTGSRASSAQGSRPGSSSSSSGDKQLGGNLTPSPADELLRSQMLSRKTIPHSPQTRASSRGSLRDVKADDLALDIGKTDEWAAAAGIRIDDILQEARKAAPKETSPGKSARVSLQRTSQSPSVSSGSIGSGSKGSSGSAVSHSPHPPATPRAGGSQQGDAPSSLPSSRAGARPQIAPLMAARLGLSMGAAPPPPLKGMRVPPQPVPDSAGRRPVPILLSTTPQKLSSTPNEAGWGGASGTPSPPGGDQGVPRDALALAGRGRAVALTGVPPKEVFPGVMSMENPRGLPRSGQPGVPPPPPRPGGRPAAMALATSGLAQRLGALQGGQAPAQRDRSSAASSGQNTPSPPQNRAGVMPPPADSGVFLGARVGGVPSPLGSRAGDQHRGASPAFSTNSGGSSGSQGLGGNVTVGMAGTRSKDGRGMATLGGTPGPRIGGMGAIPPPPPRPFQAGAQLGFGQPRPSEGSPTGRPTASGGRGGTIPPPPPRSDVEGGRGQQ